MLIYVVLRALRPGWIGWLFASTVTTAGVFLLPGRSEDITGPQLWPSATAFRFVWVYVLLSILWWGYRRHLRGKATGFILPLGTAAWIAGMTWAFESAIYSSAIWLPAFALLVWEHTGSVVPVRRRLVLVAAALTVPLAALAVVGVAIAGYYWLAAGHLPDVSAYYEVALAFGALFRSVFYKGSVGVWLLLLVFCAASTAVVSLFRRASPWALALAVASWAALWSTGSYMVVKGDAHTLLSGTPLILACLGLLLWLVNRHDGRVSAGSLPHLTFAAVLIPLFCLAFGNLPKLAERAVGCAAWVRRAGDTSARAGPGPTRPLGRGRRSSFRRFDDRR